MSVLCRASLVLALAAPVVAPAQTSPPSPAPADLAELRAEVNALRSQYEARLRTLEHRLQQAESAAARTPPSAAAPPPSVTAAPAPAPAAAPPPANAFNPAISLILSGRYADLSRDPEQHSIRGIPLPADAELGPGERGFSLAETELALSASIDPYWRGAVYLALEPDDAVAVEEAYVETTALGNGLTLKSGRFLSGIGYLNSQHAHRWDFVDAPLVYQALLGGQLRDDGLQLNWVAPTDLYLQLGAEVARGRGFPGGEGGGNGAGMASLSAHAGGDIGASHSWRAGVSYLRARADEQSLVIGAVGGDPLDASFSGRTRLWGLDGVWKWAPDGNATRTSFQLQGEVMRSERRGRLLVDPGGLASEGGYRATQTGAYLQGVVQFMPRWRFGLRADWIDPGRPRYGLNDALIAVAGDRPRRDTLMLDFSTSEFSRLRLQLARDRARVDGPDTQLILQYQMSLGAHGAHGY